MRYLNMPEDIWDIRKYLRACGNIKTSESITGLLKICKTTCLDTIQTSCVYLKRCIGTGRSVDVSEHIQSYAKIPTAI